jgi:hypothetical protein
MNRLPYVDRTGRAFRNFAQVAKDGSLLAVVEVADGAPAPRNRADVVHVDVTDLSLAKVDLFASAEVTARAQAVFAAPLPGPVAAPVFVPIDLPAPLPTKAGALA